MSDRTREHIVQRLFVTELVTRTGDAVTLVALPLTAVLVLDASPAELALIGLAQALPVFVLSLPLGAWVDGRPRRWPMLVSADLVRAGLLVLVPLMAALGSLSIPLLALIALALSTAETLFDLSMAGWVPRLLERDALHRANARREQARSAALVSGPAIGGSLVAALSAPVALLADAASFIVSALLIGSIRRDEPEVARARERSPLRGELAAGAAFIRRTPIVAAVVATVTINNFSRAIAMAVAVLYLVGSGGLGGGAVGLSFALGNGGFVVGAFLAGRVTNRLGVGRAMQLGIGLFGPSMLLFALAPAALAGPAFVIMLFANGCGIAIHNVNQVTIRQVMTPDYLRARVTAVMRIVGGGAVPTGTLVGGLIAEAAGIRWALVVSGLGLLCGSLPYVIARVDGVRQIADLTTDVRTGAAAPPPPGRDDGLEARGAAFEVDPSEA